MESSEDFQVDLTKVKVEPVEKERCIKIENFTDTTASVQPKLESINEDMMHYETREVQSAKGKIESNECVAFNNGRVQIIAARIKTEHDSNGDYMDDNSNMQQEHTVSNYKQREDVNDHVATVNIQEPEKNPPSTEQQKTEYKNWTPVTVSHLEDHINDNRDSYQKATSAPQLVNRNTTKMQEKDMRKTDRFDYRETNKNTHRKKSSTNVTNNNKRNIDAKNDEKAKNIPNRNEISNNQHMRNSSFSFKDPNKVLDPNSHIYKNRNGKRKRKNSDNLRQMASSTSSMATSNTRQSMEKKLISFVNKTTKQTRESYLIYFDDSGIEVILASHKDTDTTELYARREDPNTFYRLFYNFVKASVAHPKPKVTDKEVEIINTYIKECKEREKNDNDLFKQPRLTTVPPGPVNNSDGDIVRSARQLMKIGKGFITENGTKRQEKTQNTPANVTTDTKSSRYWACRGKRYLNKEK